MNAMQNMEVGDALVVNGTRYVNQYVACYHASLWEDVQGGMFHKDVPEGPAEMKPSDHVTVIGEDDRDYNGPRLTGDSDPTPLGEPSSTGSHPVSCFVSANGKVIYISGRSSDDWMTMPTLSNEVRDFINEHAAPGMEIRYELDDSFSHRL